MYLIFPPTFALVLILSTGLRLQTSLTFLSTGHNIMGASPLVQLIPGLFYCCSYI